MSISPNTRTKYNFVAETETLRYMDGLNEFRKRGNDVLAGGGEEKIKKQHSAGKSTARERIAMLLDAGSFIETDAFVQPREGELAADGVVCGFGTVEDRPVYVYAQDYTVAMGAIGEMHAKKICKIYDMAIKTGTPVIGLVDSAGLRLKEGMNALSGVGEILKRNVAASGVIPQICAVMGNCAGVSAFSPAMADFVVMSGESASLSLYTNRVVSATEGKQAEKCEGTSGLAAMTAANDEECIGLIKLLLSYLPDNNKSGAPAVLCADDLNRTSEYLQSISGEYDINTVIAEVADDRCFMETGSSYAPAMVTGFIRLNGSTVGVIANNNKIKGGIICTDAADKAARFVRFCDAFEIPVLTFTDTEGFALSSEQEKAGIARHAAQLFYAFAEATVPKVNVITGKAFGAAYSAMNSKEAGCDLSFAWSGAAISVAAPEIAANILFADQIGGTKNPMTERGKKIDEYIKKNASPYEAAKGGFIDDVTEPALTRPKVIAAFEMLKTKSETKLCKKHGNMPF